MHGLRFLPLRQTRERQQLAELQDVGRASEARWTNPSTGAGLRIVTGHRGRDDWAIVGGDGGQRVDSDLETDMIRYGIA